MTKLNTINTYEDAKYFFEQYKDAYYGQCLAKLTELSPYLPEADTLRGTVLPILMVTPASGKTAYHGAFEGGLFLHSYLIYVTTTNILSALGTVITPELDAMLLKCALLHDIGKAGTPDGESYYIKNTSDWHVKNQGLIYNINPNLQHLKHEDFSLLWCYGLKIELSELELCLVRYHDSFYAIEHHYNIRNYTHPVYLAFQFADNFVAKDYKI